LSQKALSLVELEFIQNPLVEQTIDMWTD